MYNANVLYKVYYLRLIIDFVPNIWIDDLSPSLFIA